MPLKTLKKPGRIPWYIRGTINGRRYDETTETTDYKLAEAYRLKREREIHDEAIYGKSVTATFSAAAEHYLEGGGSKRYLLPVIKEMGDDKLTTIDQERIDRCARKLYPRASNATRNRQVYTPIMAVMTTAAQLKWCSKPVIKRPKQPKGTIEWLRKEQALRLIEHSGHMKPLLTFMFYTGCRCAEAIFLDWSQVDLDRRIVIFSKTKNGEERGVPLHPSIIEQLRGVNHREGPVFHTPRGTPYKPLRVKPDGTVESAGARIDNGFQAAATAAGLGKVNPHMTRHSWATWHYQANRDISALMRLGGWKSEKMVMRYVHVNVDELAGTIDRL